ncbi:MAG: hypothetical protein KA144_16400, partial [Xanthomonadaceae bacterium]|nr:hypothetical protein [Xanthomonadaceae bacterium]
MSAVVDTVATTRERLRALRRQAGRIDATHTPRRAAMPALGCDDAIRHVAERHAVAPTPAIAAETNAVRPPPATHTIEDLRRLLRVRAPALAMPPRAQDRALPGEEIVSGLRFIETILREDALPLALCGAFDRREALPTR